MSVCTVSGSGRESVAAAEAARRFQKLSDSRGRVRVSGARGRPREARPEVHPRGAAGVGGVVSSAAGGAPGQVCLRVSGFRAHRPLRRRRSRPEPARTPASLLCPNLELAKCGLACWRRELGRQPACETRASRS